MKKLLVGLLLFYTAINVSAQKTETRNLGSFSGVKVQEGIDVYLKKGDKESVKVVITGANPSDVITTVSGSYLKIEMGDGRYRDVVAKVYVTYVKLDKFSALSAASIFSEGVIKANSMEITAASAAQIDLTIEVNSLEASAASAGDIELKGKAKSISVEATGAGQVDAFDLEAEKVNAEAVTGGAIKVNVTSSLTANAESGGGIRYRGNPDKQNTNSSSGGSVKKSN